MQHMITEVTARYPRLNSTYKFDTYENKSVKCDAFDDGAAYEMSFVMSDEKAKELHRICMEAYSNAAALDTKRKCQRSHQCFRTNAMTMAKSSASAS